MEKNGLSRRDRSKEAEGTKPSPNAVCTLQKRHKRAPRLAHPRSLRITANYRFVLTWRGRRDGRGWDDVHRWWGKKDEQGRKARKVEDRCTDRALNPLCGKQQVRCICGAICKKRIRSRGSSSGSRCTKIMPNTTSSNGHRPYYDTLASFFLAKFENKIWSDYIRTVGTRSQQEKRNRRERQSQRSSRQRETVMFVPIFRKFHRFGARF